MNRILLLVACLGSLAAAGRISMSPERVQDRMSLEDLQRQKFILDIVQNIRQPLQQNELIQLDQGLIVDGQRYIGGIDEDMQRVIELDRQRRLLDEHQVYSVVRPEDVQQLRGIYRLLVRAQDFDTLRRNVVYLRRNINPVLLVNALSLAIRDREDTRNLIVPAVQELLPELYLDEQVIQRARGQSQRPSLIDIVNVREHAMNPVLSILMPWRELRMQMALMRQQQALKNRQMQVQNKVVINAENQGQIDGVALLTEDIALRNFVQNLIQELALQEQDQDSREDRDQQIEDRDQRIVRLNEDREQRINEDRDQWSIRGRSQDQSVDSGRLLRVNRRRLMEQQQEGQSINQRERFERILRRDNDDDDNEDDDNRLGRVQVLRGISQGGISRLGGVRDLPVSSVDSNRLLYVNRRRVQQQQEQEQLNGRQRWMGLVRGDRLSEGRRVAQDLDENEEDVRQERRPIGRENWQLKRQQRQRLDQDDDELEQRIRQGLRPSQQLKQEEGQGRLIDRLESVSRDDDRLVHINRRRLNQDIEQRQQQQPRVVSRRINNIGEGRRVLGERLIQDEDILKLIRSDNRMQLMSDEEILEMLRRNREQRLEKNKQEDDNDNNDDDDEDDRVAQGGSRSRRSISNVRRSQDSRRREILLHNLRQLVARLNQESLAQGGDRTRPDQWMNSPQLSRLDSQSNRVLLERIGRIEERLQQIINQVVDRVNVNIRGGGIEEQRQVESLMGDVLLGRLGQVDILDIVRQLVLEDNRQEQLDRSGLGVLLSDPLVQNVLRRIVRIVDRQREEIMGAYRQEQLQMRGVSINDVRVDKLRTRIEEYDMDLSNLVQQREQRVVLGRQRRLNNRPFVIDMDISSDRDQDAIVRVFLGPAGEGIPLEERRRDFVLLDAINVQLQEGRNRIQQRSLDIPWTSRDVTPLSEIYRQLMSPKEIRVQELVGENGRFPQHLLLPRGRPEGLPMQLLVIVSPAIDVEDRQIVPEISIGIGQASLQDIRPLGYPLDRRIDNEQELLQLSNVQLQDVLIIQEN